MPREHVPFDTYGLLRHLGGRGPQRIRRDNIEADDCAEYLVSRKLAVTRGAGDLIESTETGRRVRLIDYELSKQA